MPPPTVIPDICASAARSTSCRGLSPAQIPLNKTPAASTTQEAIRI